MKLKNILALILGISVFGVMALTAKQTDSSKFPTDDVNPNWNFEELSAFFREKAEEKGAQHAFKLLATNDLPPNTDLHLLGHVIGDVLYEQEGVNGIRVCTPDFRNACSHSIVVGRLLESGEEALSQISDICKSAPGGIGAYTMCFHGLGHGVLAYAEYNLQNAIVLCGKIGSSEYANREAIECIGGAIMEIIGGGFHNQKLWAEQSKKYLSAENPLYPCNANFMPPDAETQCYTYLTPHLFTSAGGTLERPTPEDFEIAFTFCKRIPESQIGNRNACNSGFGKEFIVLAKNRNIKKNHIDTDEELRTTHTWCNLAHEMRATVSCVNSAVSSLHWGGENGIGTPVRFCNLSNSEQIQIECFKTLIGSVFYYEQSKSAKLSFCKLVPSQLQNECTKIVP